MALFFDLPSAPAAAVAGTDTGFPVRRIFCVGRNYEAHAIEMGMDPTREPPFFFTKFAEAVVPSGTVIAYPPATSNFHYEGELVVAIGAEGWDVAPERALELVFGYAAGLDMTRRDLQFAARESGRPWDMSKNFAQSAPLGTLHRVADTGHLTDGSLSLAINGEAKQTAKLSDMIWNCAALISYLTSYGRLMPGDLIFTGTPAGVGPVVPGDVVEVSISGLEPLRITIGSR